MQHESTVQYNLTVPIAKMKATLLLMYLVLVETWKRKKRKARYFKDN